MLKVDYLFSSTAATLLVIGTYGTVIAGNIFWGRRADKKFAKRPDGKAIVILESLIIGPGFLVVAYSLVFSISQIGLIIIFAVLVAVGAFCTSPLIIISQSILGDINPPELRATVFSLNNIAQTIGRSLSIITAGLLFIFFGNSYHWGFVILMSLVFGGIALIYPLKKLIPKELSKLSDLLKRRAQQLESQSAITNN
ncbi:MAG: MFS transporter, partial [Promethearchaeota archaeon]